MPELTKKEKEVFEDIYNHTIRDGEGLLRIFMDKEEIKIANTLVKKGMVYKGKTVTNQHLTSFFANVKYSKIL